MVNKINSRAIIGHLAAQGTTAGWLRQQGGVGCSDFGAILRDSLLDQAGGDRPLELAAIELLSKTLEMILARAKGRESYLPTRAEAAFSSLPWLISSLGQEKRELTILPQTERLNTAARKVWETSNSPLKDGEHPDKTYFMGSYDLEGIITRFSNQYGLDPALVRAIIAVESNWDPKAVSPAGAQGLMQLMPATAAELGVSDPLDPVQNIRGGTCYLRRLLDRYQGNLRLALAAYNWGMGNLESHPEALPKETQEYILRVEEEYYS